MKTARNTFRLIDFKIIPNYYFLGLYLISFTILVFTTPLYTNLLILIVMLSFCWALSFGKLELKEK